MGGVSLCDPLAFAAFALGSALGSAGLRGFRIESTSIESAI